MGGVVYATHFGTNNTGKATLSVQANKLRANKHFEHASSRTNSRTEQRNNE
jgi:hypothetical protein